METLKLKRRIANLLLSIPLAASLAFSASVFSAPVISNHPINIETVPQNGTIPAWRSNAQFVRVESKIYMWGGYKQCFADEVNCTQTFPNEMRTFGLVNHTWNLVSTTGAVPPGRTYQSMDVWRTPENKLHIIVYGGLDFQLNPGNGFIPYGDMWDFNTETNTWSLISAAATPGKRFGASFQIVGQKGYLFAGVEERGVFDLFEHNDLWEYNFANGVWTRLIADDPTEDPANQPGSRYRANFDYSVLMNSIVLFGGDRIVLGGPDKPHRHDTWLLRLNPTPHWDKQSDEVDPVVDPISGVLGTKHVVGFGDFEPQDEGLRCCNKDAPETDPTRYCDDPVKNIFSNKRIDQDGTHYTKFVNVSGTTALKRAAYVKVLDKIYFWGGYDLHCSAPGSNNGELTKNTTMRKLDITDLEEQ